MSDAWLRDLERRFRETDADEDLVAWLVARLRAGDLEPERVRMLAELDHEPARAALGEVGEPTQRPPGPLAQLREQLLAAHGGLPGLGGALREVVGRADTDEAGDWVLRLEPYGEEALLQAAIAAAREALPVFEKARPGDQRPRCSIEAAEDYLGCPSRAAAQKAVEACRKALAAAREIDPVDAMPGQQVPARDAACAANQAAKLAHVLSGDFDVPLEGPDEAEDSPEDAVSEAQFVRRIHAMVAARAVRYAAGATSARFVQDAIREALAKWVIG